MRKFTKQERRDIRAVLVSAKLKLWDGRKRKYNSLSSNTFICHAIDASWSPTLQAKVNAKRVITSRLEGYCTLGEWLMTKVNIPAYKISTLRIQQHRHAWLDLLIKEFSR